jgi:hypothetical protein
MSIIIPDQPDFKLNALMRRNWSPNYVKDKQNYALIRFTTLPMSESRSFPQIINRPNPSLCGEKFDDTWAPAVTMTHEVLHHNDYGTLWVHENSEELVIVFRDGSWETYETTEVIDTETGDIDYWIKFNGWYATIGECRAMAFYDGTAFKRGQHLKEFCGPRIRIRI